MQRYVFPCVSAGLLVWSLCVPGVAFSADPAPWNKSLPLGLAELLQEVHQKYGPDTIALLGRLLDTARRSGGLLTASVEVTGIETRQEQTFLTFRVQTGLIYNSLMLSQTDRLLDLWTKIVAQSFLALRTLEFPADGILLALHYYSRPYGSLEELNRALDDPSQVGEANEARFYFSEQSLHAFLNEELSAQELLTRTTILANGRPVALQLPPPKSETWPFGRGLGG